MLIFIFFTLALIASSQAGTIQEKLHSGSHSPVLSKRISYTNTVPDPCYSYLQLLERTVLYLNTCGSPSCISIAADVFQAANSYQYCFQHSQYSYSGGGPYNYPGQGGPVGPSPGYSLGGAYPTASRGMMLKGETPAISETK